MSTKLLRVGVVVMLAISLLALTGSYALAGRLVDQKAEIDLMPKMEGSLATGTAELRLRIDDEGMLELFRIRVDAEGLTPDTTHSLFVGKHLLATDVTDADGKVTFDVEFKDMIAHKDTLVGLKVKVVQDTPYTVVLFGKVTEADIDSVLDEED
ncbi:MAG: hypothetical protein HYX81_02590 [Chloroflexi bacterium]|nr:hypothetical protein [Chloroflexota bacterium]